ncbi:MULTISPECIES: hypothetical protein [Nocardiaceae]|uniref:hypothetical protein n=1 Tax=Nocardiaceae TaxID=85025 RepID=UPI000AF06C80|nr:MULTISPECIES: hypothetical protein [Rhodococcus]
MLPASTALARFPGPNYQAPAMKAGPAMASVLKTVFHRFDMAGGPSAVMVDAAGATGVVRG